MHHFCCVAFLFHLSVPFSQHISCLTFLQYFLVHLSPLKGISVISTSISVISTSISVISTSISTNFQPDSLFIPMVHQLLVGQDLLVFKATRSHSGTPHSVGLLWTSDQLDAETSTWQHTTLTRLRLPLSRWDSNPQSHQASGSTPIL